MLDIHALCFPLESSVCICVAYKLQSFFSFYATGQGRGYIHRSIRDPETVVWVEETTDVNTINHAFALSCDQTCRPGYATVFVRLCLRPFTETQILYDTETLHLQTYISYNSKPQGFLSFENVCKNIKYKGKQLRQRSIFVEFQMHSYRTRRAP